MKIVCDACAAKYSIADEKVQGKVFKIRCKKCSNVIVVRGTGEEAAPAAAPAAGFDQKETRVYDYGGEGGAPAGDEGLWHIVVDQEQVGPLTVAEVGARFAAGELDADSYIWREGYADWLPLAQVADFAHLIAGGAAAAPAAPASAGQDAVASMFGASHDDDGAARSDPNDLFAARAPAAAEERPVVRAREQPAPAPAAAGGAASAMRGQRNESSVLFSLGNLTALAADAPRAAPAGASSPAPGAAGHGGSEGSGLIDIRSMASAYMGPSKAAAGPGGARVGSADDLPVFSTAAFSEPAVIIPMGGARNDNKMIYILLGAVGLLAVLAVVLVVVVLGKEAPARSEVAVNDQAADAGGAERAGAGSATTTGSATGSGAGSATGSATGSGAGSATGSATGSGAGSATGSGAGSATGSGAGSATGSGAGSATGAATAGSGRGSSSGSGRGSSSGSGRGSSSGSGRGSSSGSGSARPPVVEPPPAGGKCNLDEMGCLLADKKPACCSIYGGGKRTPPPPPPPPPGNKDLPAALVSTDISAGLAKIKPKATACGAKSSAKGKVQVQVKVAPSGAVSSVSVKETPDPALGSCVAAAVKQATFAKTQTGGSFQYPFRF